MNSFSKKTEIIFSICTAFMLLCGTLLVAFSNRFVPLLYDFFSNVVFHRDFKLEKWISTLQSIVIIPIFVTIFINTILFHKYSEKVKIFLLSEIVLLIAFLVFFTVFTTLHKFIEGDLASETLLAKECVREKSLVPLGWGYSTEIRLLNTQLISAPLFLVFKSWNLVRALTSVISCAVLFLSCWYLLGVVGIKKVWLKFWGSALVSCPWSSLHFYVIGWGNYYIPHIVLGFLTISLYIPILNSSTKNRNRSIVIFYLLAFISGLSTIRYILIYQFPLALAMTIMTCKSRKFFSDFSLNEFKNFFAENKALSVSIIALCFSGMGYIFNNLFLHHLYNFSQWNDVAFNFFGDVPLLKLFSTILKSFGYQENIAVFTPGGIINICVYVALSFFIASIISSLQSKLSPEKKLLLIFTICTISFNTFLYYHTEFIGRFYITILAYVIPCLVIFTDNTEISVAKRYFTSVSFSLCIFASSFTALQNYLTTDDNKLIYPVMNFLKEKQSLDADYSFGYSTFDFANMVTYFSDEKIEVAPIEKEKRNGQAAIPYRFKESVWLTPLRLNDYKTNGKVFFLTSKSLYDSSLDNTVFDMGKEVFNDGSFLVFEYANQELFKSSFGKKTILE